MSEIDALLRVREGLASDRLRSAVETLGMLLEAHFSHEESSAMFTELPLEFPRFTREIEMLKRQHIEMLAEIGAIQSGAADSGQEELVGRLQDLLVTLDRHERVERELLQRAYTEDIASVD